MEHLEKLKKKERGLSAKAQKKRGELKKIESDSRIKNEKNPEDGREPTKKRWYKSSVRGDGKTALGGGDRGLGSEEKIQRLVGNEDSGNGGGK